MKLQVMIKVMKDKFIDLENHIIENLPASANKTIARRHLEIASMYAVKCIINDSD